MANSNGWGDGAANNAIGWGQGANNAIGWGDIHADSWAGLTDISGLPTTDPDAQAFITAAAITDPTQQAAINTLVVDLKGYNIWTKMKALYPFVGGTASTHKFNLKDPRDLNAAFRLVFNGGWTHSSTGATPNGTNGYADTFLIPNTSLANSSGHLSVYSRTNISGFFYDMGAASGAGTAENSVISRWTDNKFYSQYGTPTYPNTANTDSRGLFITNRNSATNTTGYKNGSKVIDTAQTSSQLSQTNVYLGATNAFGSSTNYSPRNYAFASIGDGLTDTEAANFYTAVQAFQTAIGRSIVTQTVSDADAQAFVTAANIQDQVEANAINNLVIGMKADGLWTKMKAVYPFVGVSSTSNSYNLRNTAQYQINWNGGWTWNSNGVTGNGVNGWGNTGLIPNSVLTLNSTHQSLYIRNTGNLGVDDFGSATNATTSLMRMIVKNSGTNDHIIDHYAVAQRITGTVADSTGFFVVSRENSTSLKSKRNDVSLGTNTNSNTGTLPTHALYLGALNNIGTAVNYTARNYAFASAGDGLSDTDMTNLRNRVVTFQTALNRNV